MRSHLIAELRRQIAAAERYDGQHIEMTTREAKQIIAALELTDAQRQDITLAAAVCEAFDIGTCGATLRGLL